MAAAKKAEMEKFRKVWAKIIARAWVDDQFKQKLLSRPLDAFKEYGATIPAGMNLKILEESSKAKYLILPEKPDEELSAEELKTMAAAGMITLAHVFHSGE